VHHRPLLDLQNSVVGDGIEQQIDEPRTERRQSDGAAMISPQSRAPTSILEHRCDTVSAVSPRHAGDVAGPFDGYRDLVRPEWIDHNGHMNMGYYLVVFDLRPTRGCGTSGSGTTIAGLTA
jgi:hypothetical protein